MLVTPNKGTDCLTLTLVVDATVMVPLPNVSAYRSNTRSVALGLLGSQPESDRLAFIPRWRTACRVSGHKLVSHAEQVPQDILCDAGQANQHGGSVSVWFSRLAHRSMQGLRRHEVRKIRATGPNRR
jgi:hypothetical protein